MFGIVPTTQRALDDYRSVIPDEEIDRLYSLAEPLRGVRVLHLSVTAFGTGVADMLGTAAPLMADLGVDCRWQIVRSGEEFQQVNRAMYAALVGGSTAWNDQLTDTWLRYSEMNAGLLDEPFDVIVVHDPQPAGIRSFLSDRSPASRARWVWHSHLDLSEAQEHAWLLLKSQVEKYDAAVYESQQFAVRSLRNVPTYVIPPATDPLAPRNMDLSQDALCSVLGRYGIDVDWPVMAQISPMDENNRPLGAIEVYRRVKEQVPDIRLILVATVVPSDLATRTYLDRVVEEASGDPDLVVLPGVYSSVGNVELNVMQRCADVVYQHALCKGFGLWVAEAMYKARPVVAGQGKGLSEQIRHGETGFHCEGTQELADCVIRVLRDGELAKTIGNAGRRHVESHFLITRFVADYLQLLRSFA